MEDWKEKLEKIKQSNIDLSNSKDFNKPDFFQNLRYRWSIWINERDRVYNSVQFNYFLRDSNQLHNNVRLLQKGIRKLGEDSIYDIIKRTLQIDGYSAGVSLYCVLVFPTYIKLNDLNYFDNQLYGTAIFHKIYDNSKIFFRIYSHFNKIEENFLGQKEFQLKVNESENLKNNFYSKKFTVDFSEYKSEPHFKIRLNSPLILPNEYLLDFEEPFSKEMDYIIYKDKKIKAEDKRLDLINLGIRNIIDLKGLENLKDLKELNLTSNNISKIEGLDNLIELKILHLGGNKISKIEGLKNLKKLEDLRLMYNKIIEIEGLETLTNLKKIYLSLNRISEIKGLDNLINLEILDLYDNQIEEINGLKKLKKLNVLKLGSNKIIEIKGIEHLENLRE